MIYELNHVGIIVTDLERSLAFYRDGLGAAVVFRKMRLDGAAEIVYLRLGDGLIELIGGMTLAPPRKYGLDHLGFMTDDIDADYLHLIACGARAVKEPATAGTGVGKTALVFDDNGVRVELVERDADFRPTSGAAAAVAIDHFSIAVTDTQRARVFYGSTIGMADRGEVSDGSDAFEVAIGRDVLCVCGVPGAGTISSISLAVSDVRVVAARVAEHAGAAHPAGLNAALPDGATVVHDPDGCAIFLMANARTTG